MGAERSPRGIAAGQNSWLFFGVNNGGQTAALRISFIATCKRLETNPFIYRQDVFQLISTHPTNRLDELLPDTWEAAQDATKKTSTRSPPCQDP